MSLPTPRDIWASVLGNLQLEVARHNYDTWLRDTVGLHYANGRLVVGVPSPFVAECLEQRMTPLILRTVKDLLQADVEVLYEVRQDGAAFLPSPHPGRGGGASAPLTGHLNPRYVFDSFVVGKSNRFAHAAAMAVAENPGTAYNPLFVHAGVGLGKTHLLHAIGHAVAARGLHYLYASAEQFTNDFVSALRESRLEEFRGKYRSLDVLLIDDIQFIAGKEHSRESFFHTFNDLHTSGRQIVITSDSRPKSIPLLEERLSSRFEGGLTADIDPPDLETRMAIVGKKAELAGVRLRSDIVDFLSRKFLRNVRELEGALNRVLAMAIMTNRPVDLELATQALADTAASSPRRLHASPQDIVDTVAAYYHMTPVDLAAKSRKKNVAHARHVAAYLLREETPRSLADIGRFLGDRGHSTILRAHDKVVYEINVSSDLRRQITEIRDLLDRRPPTASA